MLRGIFFLVGVILFTAQLSGKFYWSASMPVSGSAWESGSAAAMHDGSYGHRTLDNIAHVARLSLDKRYDLATVFDLPSPIIRATPYTVGASPVLPLRAGDPLSGVPVLPLLRGPPSPMD
ncbi:MAG TPA: hypothetical protein VGS79_12915 [Puia sp.]|nr:hypothetical protein [Puia sp.]